MIDAVSFKAWSGEAFGIWRKWERMYPPGSESARLLNLLQQDLWLVNIVHHDFVDQLALWMLLLQTE
jgi:methylenetetrahydrofolate reductase (NADPH)